jgi:GNAT superfamily N-acetyltransferase
VSQDLKLRALDPTDREQAVVVINTAADWYREFLPPDEAAGPEITADDWDTEATRMTWYGAFAGDGLVGVMGAEYVHGVALLRHAYVLPRCQRQGVGSILRQHVESQISVCGPKTRSCPLARPSWAAAAARRYRSDCAHA